MILFFINLAKIRQLESFFSLCPKWVNRNLSQRSPVMLGVSVVDSRPLVLLMHGVVMLECSVRLHTDDVITVVTGNSFMRRWGMGWLMRGEDGLVLGLGLVAGGDRVGWLMGIGCVGWHMAVGWLPQLDVFDQQLSCWEPTQCVSVCVCAYPPWKMPPSVIHTYIVGANKGYMYFLFAFVPVVTEQVAELNHSLAHHYRSMKAPRSARPSKVAFSKRKSWTMTAQSDSDVYFYFSAQWSERDWGKGFGSVYFLLFQCGQNFWEHEIKGGQQQKKTEEMTEQRQTKQSKGNNGKTISVVIHLLCRATWERD